MNDQFIKEMFDNLKKRKSINKNKSYTAHLINNHELLAKKIGEESSELIIDLIKKKQRRNCERICRFNISLNCFVDFSWCGPSRYLERIIQ